MNRPIKFRMWNGNNMVDLKSTTQFAIKDDLDIDGLFIPFKEEWKLMQFTGLKDKNGKEIYELHEIDHKYRVVYLFNKYILQSISNRDIFVEIIANNEYEITGEYCPMEKN